jgi:hypothetical protein
MLSTVNARAVSTTVYYDPEFGIWSSPNVPSLVKPIPPFQREPPSDLRYDQLRRPHWLPDFYPYLAFWPLKPSWTGPIFGRLSFNAQSLEIIQSYYDSYGLPYALVIAWQRLETALLGLAEFLLRRRFKNLANFRYMQFPSDCGYKSQHSQAKFARTCAYKSRDAFLTLATICSFAIAANMADGDSAGLDVQWITACEHEGVHTQWLADLQDSFVCNFSPGFRAGAYVHGLQSPWAACFPAFQIANIPLFIIWGRRSGVPQHEDMQAYLPTNEEVSNAKDIGGRPVLGTHYSALDGPPVPYSASRQMRGETQEEFVSRMCREELEYSVMQSEEDQLEMQGRIHQASVEQFDTALEEPTVGTAMFEWVELPGGYFLRKQVPRMDWASKWVLKPSYQKRYYGMIDEWDLDADVADAGPSQSTDVEYREPSSNDDGLDFMQASLQDHGVQLTNDDFPAIDKEKDVYLEDLRSVYGVHVPVSTVDVLPLAEVLRLRYGFMSTVPYTTHPRMKNLLHTHKTAKDVQRAVANLGVKHSKDTELGPAVLDLYNFIIANGKTPMAFASLWDYNPTFKNVITQHKTFQYYRVDSELHLIGVTGQSLHSQWYLLAIRNATTVLHIFRSELKTHGDITRRLISNGIPFSTVKCLSRKPAHATPRKSIGLGLRQHGHNFDVLEYLAYEKAKNDVLSSSVGRAALTEGGIVWRLAKDIVRSKAVLRGPSESAKTEGNVVGYLGRHVLVDDLLQAADEDILCGVYHVEPGIYYTSFVFISEPLICQKRTITQMRLR